MLPTCWNIFLFVLLFRDATKRLLFSLSNASNFFFIDYFHIYFSSVEIQVHHVYIFLIIFLLFRSNFERRFTVKQSRRKFCHFRNLTKWIFFFFYCCRTKMKIFYTQKFLKKRKKNMFLSRSNTIVLCQIFSILIHPNKNIILFELNLRNVHIIPNKNQFEKKKSKKKKCKGSTFTRYACAFNGCLSNTKNQ